MPPIVVDKSYLQATSAELVKNLSHADRILMTEALFFEILSNPQDRALCFSKFSPGENPVDLVLHIGGYLQKEVGRRKPAPKPSAAILPLRFEFNQGLQSPDYHLPEGPAQVLEEQIAEIRQDVDFLWGRAQDVKKDHPAMFTGSDQARAAVRQELENEIATSRSAIRDFYGNFRAPKGAKKFPPKHHITEQWFIYRWVQVKLLFSIDVAFRYQQYLEGDVPDFLVEKLEHDVLDAQYLMVGLHQGAFATNEAKLIRWFRLLNPGGRLLTAAANHSLQARRP